MNTATKRYAFISYNHKDKDMAKWLQAKLESYKLPTEIHNEFEDSRYLRPVFRDKTDLNTGILSDELRKNLQTSKYLVVLCSPNSAHSKWVNDEVKAFIEGKRDEGTFLSILGFGSGNYRDSTMETLAQNGNGVYYYIDGESEAQKVFGTDLISTLYTVAKDVKMQLELQVTQQNI